ncbi:hypothetical protein GCM10028790_64410 [Micromonospora taraxaci]|uniref:Peptidase inhibitor family I36 n=1 Tax=Micromonospora taraxaci TaxID=1316803 RepID=A0A561VXR1_9ACTN|nr:peptidase inhibitor family I36 protein [Micromonospora taraxaci]TWG16400.1 peptidase inhibitor family I36 [Micromonospora taraxaci]
MGKGNALAAAATLGIVALFVVPGVAAAGNPGVCKSNKMCIYNDNDFSGLIDIPRDPGGGIRTVSSKDNDKMDSWENRTSSRGSWYYDANGGGDCVRMTENSEDNNINVFDSDELTSWRTDRGCS